MCGEPREETGTSRRKGIRPLEHRGWGRPRDTEEEAQGQQPYDCLPFATGLTLHVTLYTHLHI